MLVIWAVCRHAVAKHVVPLLKRRCEASELFTVNSQKIGRNNTSISVRLLDISMVVFDFHSHITIINSSKLGKLLGNGGERSRRHATTTRASCRAREEPR